MIKNPSASKPPAPNEADAAAPANEAAAGAPQPETAAPPAKAPARAPATSRSKALAKAQAAYAAPAPMPVPTSRFADRFAPPRPPTRQMNHLGAETPKPTQKADPKLVNAWKTKSGKDLTEAELLAMPEAEYMNEKQLEFFRQRLQALKDDLLSNAGETTEHLREDTTDRPRPRRPRHHRGGARPRAAHARPRAQAAEEDLAVADAHRLGRLRLLRRDRRADRPRPAARPSHRHAVARGAAAARDEAEDVRRLNTGCGQLHVGPERHPELLPQGRQVRRQSGDRLVRTSAPTRPTSRRRSPS